MVFLQVSCGSSLHVGVTDICSLVCKEGESFELVLVDLLDDAVVDGCQNGFFTRKVLVKVIDVWFSVRNSRRDKCFLGESQPLDLFVQQHLHSLNKQDQLFLFS